MELIGVEFWLKHCEIMVSVCLKIHALEGLSS